MLKAGILPSDEAAAEEGRLESKERPQLASAPLAEEHHKASEPHSPLDQ